MTLNYSLRNLLLPPRFQDDEQNRIAGVLYTTAVAILTGLCALVFYRQMTGQFRLVIPILVMCGITYASILLVRRELVAWSASLLSWALLGFLCYMIVFNDGIHDTAVLALPGVLVLAGLVLKKRYFFVFTVVTLLLVAVTGYLEINGVIHNAYNGRTHYPDILDVVVILGIIAVTVRLLSDNLIGSLALARENEKAIRAQADQLKESEQNYRTLFEAANDAILILSGDRFVQCNNMTLEMFGCKSRSDLIGHFPWEFSPAQQPDGRDSQEKAIEVIQRALNGTPQRFSWKHCRKDGSFFDAEVSLSSVESGNEVFIQALVRDITERTRGEEALRESEERFSVLSDAAFEGIVISEKGRIIDVNRQLADMFGYGRSEMPGLTVESFVAPESLETVMQHIRSASEEPYEHLSLRKDGTIFPVEIRAKSIPYKGRIVRVTAVRDITERKRTEEELRRYQLLSQNTRDIILFLRSNDGQILEANEAAVGAYGYNREELMKKSIRDLRAPETSSDPTEHPQEAILRGVSFETTHLRRDGTVFPVEVSSRGMIVGSEFVLMSIMRDITERKQAEEALQVQSRLQELLMNMSTTFINLPLNAVESAIRNSLGEMGRFVEATRAFVFEYDFHNQITSATHEWCNEGIESRLAEFQAVPLTAVPEWDAEAHRRGESIWIADTNSLPSGLLRDMLGRPDSRSGLYVPCMGNGECLGFVGFAWELPHQALPNNEQRLLSIFANMLVNVQERKRVEETLKRSEERLLSTINNTPYVAVQWYDEDGRVRFWNHASELIFGWKSEEAVGRTLDQTIHTPEGAAEFRAALETIKRTGQPVGPMEYYFKRRDGSEGICLSTTFEIPSGDGHDCFVCMDVDVTERRRAEHQSTLLAQTLKSAKDCISITDLEDNVLFVNDAFTSTYGYAEADLLGKKISTVRPEKMSPNNGSTILSATMKGGWHGEVFNRRKDGTEFPVELWTTLVRDTVGVPIAMAGVARDITERKQADKSLRDSELFLRKSQEVGGLGSYYLDIPTGNWTCSEKLDDIFGIDSSYRKGLEGWLDLVHPDDKEMMLQHFTDHVLVKHNKFDREYRVIRQKDKKARWVHGLGELEFDERGNPAKMIGTIRDITERKRTEKRIEEQARLLDVARDAIIVRDIHDKLLYMNRAAEQLYGWTFEEAKEIPSDMLLADSDREKFLENKNVFMENGEWEGELRQKTKEGKELIVQTRWTLVRNKQGKPSARLIINRDITEKRSLEAQFRRAQRLESLGTLAGGIAHDLNNVLAPITMSLALLDRKVTDPSLKRYIATLESSAQRGGDIVKQVLLFARGSEKDYAPQQLRYIVREITTIIHETFPRNIELQTDIPKDLTFVMGDATQLHQVLMNLCVNARDAMPEGGQLTIAASNVRVGEADAKTSLGCLPGEYVVLSVSDTGTGIPKEIQEKIFEPFFTTKELGKGTGLGLSTVYAIVKDHKGFINLYSEVGKGTSFKLYLPAAQDQEVAESSALPITIPSGNDEVILVVDDEQAVLEITRAILEARGYRVLTATNGAEAVSVFAAAARGSIQLVLTDVNMPVMDGHTAVETIRRLDPDVKVIIASGLVTDLDPSKHKESNIQGYLMKPFTSERMLIMLHELLGR